MAKGIRKLQLTGPLKLVKGARTGNMLRCTLVESFIPEGARESEIESHSTDGCLIMRDSAGDLSFKLPRPTVRGRQLSIHSSSPAFDKRVLGLLTGTKWPSRIGQELLPDHLAIILPEEPGFPQEINEEVEK